MNYEKRGPWPISSVNSFFSGCSFNGALILVFNYCIRKLITMTIQWALVPLIVLSGLWLWKGHWIRKWGRKRNKLNLINN